LGQTSSRLRDLVFRTVPAFDSLRRYRVADARSDLLAGLTVSAVAVPQAMAYAMIIGVPPIYGLYTAIVMTAIGALFDSSRQLINGPTNAISIAVLSAVAAISPPEQRLATIFLMTFMIGLIQLGISLFRLGDLTRYISHSVIVGFTFGAGSLLVIDQMKNLLGMRAMGDAHDHLLVRFWLSMTEGGGLHPETTLVGLGSIALVLALRAIKRRLGWALMPDLFIAVCVMAGLCAWLDLDQRGVKVVGAIPAALPGFQLPAFDAVQMESVAGGALAIALLGLLEAISMAKAIASVTRQKLDMNQQCLSEALANLGGSFFQCIPGSGSLTRSAINQQAGAVTQWSGVISAVGVAAIMLVFAPYAQYLPKATLAGILLVVSYGMVDWQSLAYHWRATRFDAAIVGVTAFSAVAISVEFCVMIGVLMSFMLTVPRAGRMLLTQFVIGAEGYTHERLPGDVPCPRLLIFGLEGELFFGASSALERHFESIESRVGPETQVIVLRLKRVRNPDAVALAELEHFLVRMKARQVRVLMCGVHRDLHGVMERVGLVERIGEQIFLEQPVRQTSTMRAIQHAYTLIEQRCEHCPWHDAPRPAAPARSNTA
jgi:sulfate permease, SulP family